MSPSQHHARLASCSSLSSPATALYPHVLSRLGIGVLCVQLALAPFAAAAQTGAASAAVAQQELVYSDKLAILEAVDTGNSARLQQYIQTIRLNHPLGHNTESLLNFTDQAGNTPLIRASMHNNPEISRILLANGADINAVNNAGESALVTSYNYGNPDIASYLLAQGAADPYGVAALLTQPAATPVAGGAAAAGAGGAWTALELASLTVLAGGAVAGTAIAIGSSGGSDSSSSPPVTTPSPPVTTPDAGVHPQNEPLSNYTTTEAAQQEGHGAMKTSYALARGYDGRIYSRNASGTLASTTPTGFVKVAVMDSGVDLTHPDLAPNLVSGSVTCGGAGCVAGGENVDGHGTWVAGIIAARQNGVGIYGVAPQAKFISIRATDGDGNYTTRGDVTGIQYAVANGVQVINSSFGTTLPFNSFTPAQVNADLNVVVGGTTARAQYQNMVANKVINVFAAGNNGADQPSLPAALPYYFQGATAPAGLSQASYDLVNPGHLDWSKHWIAAISLDANNQISSFSQDCGVAKNWCLAAPGQISNSTAPGGGYSGPIQGTSFAAPNVTGAVAVMLGAFPHLAPETVTQILFDTATDLGTPGVDDVYGHGLVNLQKATSPSDGGWTLATGSTSFAFDMSGFALSAPFGNALASTDASLQFLDSYGKNYEIGLTSLGGNLTSARPIYDRMSRENRSDFDTLTPLGYGMTLGFAAESTPNENPNLPAEVTPKFSPSSDLVLESDTRATFGVNSNTDLAYALLPETQKSLPDDALKNPYLGLMKSSSSTVAGLSGGGVAFTVAAYRGRFDDEEYGYRFENEKPVSGVYSEASYDGIPKTRLTLGGGMVREENSLLGSETSGAFSIDHALTYHTGLAAQYQAAENVGLFANYHLGMTEVRAAENSIFRSFENLTTSAFALGGRVTDVAGQGDTLGLVLSQPLRVMHGSADLTQLRGIASDGTMLYDTGRMNLAPDVTGYDLGLYYNAALTPASSISLDGVLRMNPDNTDTGSDAALLAKYILNF